MLYDYFKQLFAQVTNPPIDAIREDGHCGFGRGNDGGPGRATCSATEAGQLPPVASGDPHPQQTQELARNSRRHIREPGFRSRDTMPMLFDAHAGAEGCP